MSQLDGRREVSSGELLVEVLVQAAKCPLQVWARASEGRQNLSLLSKSDDRHAEAGGIEARRENPGGLELRGQDGVVEVLPFTEPLHQRIVSRLTFEPGDQGGIGAAQRSIAIEIDPRVLQGALGDVDRDHHVVAASAAGAAVATHLEECVLHPRFDVPRRIDDQPRTLLSGRSRCQE